MQRCQPNLTPDQPLILTPVLLCGMTNGMAASALCFGRERSTAATDSPRRPGPELRAYRGRYTGSRLVPPLLRTGPDHHHAAAGPNATRRLPGLGVPHSTHLVKSRNTNLTRNGRWRFAAHSRAAATWVHWRRPEVTQEKSHRVLDM